MPAFPLQCQIFMERINLHRRSPARQEVQRWQFGEGNDCFLALASAVPVGWTLTKCCEVLPFASVPPVENHEWVFVADPLCQVRRLACGLQVLLPLYLWTPQDSPFLSP